MKLGFDLFGESSIRAGVRWHAIRRGEFVDFSAGKQMEFYVKESGVPRFFARALCVASPVVRFHWDRAAGTLTGSLGVERDEAAMVWSLFGFLSPMGREEWAGWVILSEDQLVDLFRQEGCGSEADFLRMFFDTSLEGAVVQCYEGRLVCWEPKAVEVLTGKGGCDE